MSTTRTGDPMAGWRARDHLLRAAAAVPAVLDPTPTHERPFGPEHPPTSIGALAALLRRAAEGNILAAERVTVTAIADAFAEWAGLAEPGAATERASGALYTAGDMLRAAADEIGSTDEDYAGLLRAQGAALALMGDGVGSGGLAVVAP